MRVVIQRVTRAEVRVDGKLVGRIDVGLLVLLGAGQGDDEKAVDAMVDKVLNLRIFRDDEGRMNRSLLDVGGAMLVVSQFTLFGDARKGRRPSFTRAMEPKAASELVDLFCDRARAAGVQVETGIFGAMMDVESINDGPVTILLDSTKLF